MVSIIIIVAVVLVVVAVSIHSTVPWRFAALFCVLVEYFG